MYREHTVGVVVPAYDEAEFVGEVVETIPDFVDRVYPVDDASTDETWAEIRTAAHRVNAEASDRADGGEDGANAVPDGSGALRPPAREAPENNESETKSPEQRRVVPLRHEENRGVGGAIKTGYREARADGMDAVVVMAGDGQMDPDQLPRLLDPVVSGRAEYAKGDRLAMDAYCEEMSRWRRFGNGLLTYLTRISSGYWSMSDPQNGYTAISAEALDELDLDAVFDDYGFANAMLVHLNVADLRIADVPMPAKYGDEESGIRYSTFVPQLSALLAKGFVWRLAEKHVRRDLRTFALLYGLGVVGILLGVVRTAQGWFSGGERDRDDRQNELQTELTTDETDSERDERVYRGGRTERDGQAERERRTQRDEPTERIERDEQTGRTGRCGPVTVLAGLATAGLAMALDAGHNEDLHVTVDEEEAAFESERDERADADESTSGGER